MRLCRAVDAPPRLIAHLTLVHDVADRLISSLHNAFPNLEMDTDSILFGAATHDIGKAIHREELTAPGKLHELRGVDLLRELGISEHRARFALTHGNWRGNFGSPENPELVNLKPGNLKTGNPEPENSKPGNSKTRDLARDLKKITLEDLLVALADNCWKGKRVPDLETEVVNAISRATGKDKDKDAWLVFSILDDILQELAADADQRLAWQAQFPTEQ